MRRIHIIIYALLAVLALGSCSRQEVDPREAIMAQIGPDFDRIFVIDPTQIAKSAGEESLGRLFKSDSELFSLIASAQGLDKTVAAVVAYSNPKQAAILMAATDAGKVQSSLRKAGWTEQKTDGGTVFSSIEQVHYIVLDHDNALWLVRARSADDAATAVAALKARAGALPQWLSKELEEHSESAAVFALALSDTLRTVGYINIEGATARGRATDLHPDGSAINRRLTPDSQSAANIATILDPKANLSMLGCLPEGLGFSEMFNALGHGFYPANLRGAIEALDGRFALSAVMVDPQADITDFSNYRFALGAGVKDGEAPAVVADICSAARMAGLPMRGSSLSFGGTELLQATAPYPDMALIASPGYKPAGNPEVASRSLWLHLSLPRGASLLNMLGLDCGVAADATSDGTHLEFTIDFPDSSQGFVANIIQIADNF